MRSNSSISYLHNRGVQVIAGVVDTPLYWKRTHEPVPYTAPIECVLHTEITEVDDALVCSSEGET